MNRITQGMDQEEMSVMEQETRFALFQQNPDCKIAVQKKNQRRARVECSGTTRR